MCAMPFPISPLDRASGKAAGRSPAKPKRRSADFGFRHGGQAMTAGVGHRWTRVLFNAGEPTNSLSMWGIEGPDGSVHAVGCRLSGRFNDGPARCAILLNDDGTFAWFSGDEKARPPASGRPGRRCPPWSRSRTTARTWTPTRKPGHEPLAVGRRTLNMRRMAG